jgi:hypothetical protein
MLPTQELIQLNSIFRRPVVIDRCNYLIWLVPVWLEVLSGNSSDKKTFKATIKAYCKQLRAEEQAYVVMDSAGFSEDTLKAAQDILWVMRVPETLAQAKKLVKETPAEEMLELEPGYWGKEVVCEYAGVKQRWLVVFSQAAQGRELKTLQKAQAKEMEKAQKEWRKLAGQTFNCQADAEKALEQFNQKWKYHRVVAQAIPVRQYSRRGRPTAEDQKEVMGYNLEGSVEEDTMAIEEVKRSFGRFIIATNDLDTERLSARAMLENYKDQGVSVERGFRFLKDPLFFAHSLFLKKPERLMAMLMIMGLALLIYSLAERKLRQALKEMNATVPDQRRKPTQRPTIRWIFQLFEGLDILLVKQNGEVMLRPVAQLAPGPRTSHYLARASGPKMLSIRFVSLLLLCQGFSAKPETNAQTHLGNFSISSRGPIMDHIILADAVFRKSALIATTHTGECCYPYPGMRACQQQRLPLRYPGVQHYSYGAIQA